MATFLLLLFGFACFTLAALGVTASKVNLPALGLASWILVSLIGAWP